MRNFQSGQAALITVILVLALAVVITVGINLLAVQRHIAAREQADALQSYYLAEAGIEDSLLRVISDDHTHEANTSLTLSGHTATINISETETSATITSEGDVNNRIRKLSTELEKNTTGASFFYGIQVDDGGLTMANNSRVNGNVYSNGDITGGNGATITGDATVAGALDAAPAVEWTTHNSDQFFATASSNRDIAQSFTATESNTIPQVAVYLGKAGNPMNNLTLRLTNDNNGKPETSSLANTTIPFASVSTTPGWITVPFTSPPTVESGSKYWIVLDYGSNSTSNYWNWRKDNTGGYANNTGSTTGNWSAGGATWTSVNGDLAFQVWIGGTAKKIQDMVIGDATTGTGRANLFVNTTIHGSACPNQYCLIENPGRQELPIPAETIQGWKDAAETGGTCVQPQCNSSGDYELDNNAVGSLGPKKITGNLKVANGATLTLTGTVWVQGDIQLSNGCIIKLDSSYGATSGVLLTDDAVQISNNCEFEGSGDPNSYILLLSDKDDTASNVMTISNNSVGVIYYAPRGRLHFSNNAQVKEATAYGISLENGATITYESGLQNINFSSGPSGGWTFGRWQEID